MLGNRMSDRYIASRWGILYALASPPGAFHTKSRTARAVLQQMAHTCVIDNPYVTTSPCMRIGLQITGEHGLCPSERKVIPESANKLAEPHVGTIKPQRGQNVREE